jgi:UDP-N-acetylmuramyl pentapeptide phosphotransferase/UDP-N-acetylglucosamine-1-phosphate transferase
MVLLGAYLFLLIGWVALLVLEATSWPLGIAVAMIVYYGILVMRTSIRYKERIIRDMRVVHHIHDLALESDSDRKLIDVFRDYRLPRGAKKPPQRLSTTRHYLLAINLGNSLTLGYTTLLLTGNWAVGAVVGAVSLLVHEVIVALTRKTIAFNI